MKIAFIGGGNMGEAMLAAVLKSLPGSHGISIRDISISDASEARRLYIEQKYFKSEYGKKFSITVVDSNPLAINEAEVVVLAIKPQSLPGVMAELSGQIKATQLVLSIVAGARIDTLRTGLKHESIVRSMPNTPAQIGEGMTVWTATAAVNPQQKQWAGAILGALGKEIYVDDEKYLDMATAVSGSGPAYFFLFVESLVEAAVSIGLSRDTAEQLVLQTMIGSGHLIQKSGKAPAELRRMVTSPGGTTAEAIARFEQGGLKELVRQAVAAAYSRAKQLGG